MEKAKRALVVDDSLTNRVYAHVRLESFGFEVECANNGSEAIDIIEAGAERYDVIFLDYLMPGLDGIDTVRRIRQMESEHARRVPIIAWTNHTDTGTPPELFLKSGFSGCLRKPIEHKELRKVLEAV